MQVSPLAIPEVLLLEPKVFGDARGFFMETFSAQRYREAGIVPDFVQDNVSYSAKGILRGLHVQHPKAQGKLVSVLKGEVFDVAVDVRRGSPSFGKWVGATLSADNKRQLWVPPGFAHGFVVTGDDALFCYKCTDYYSPTTEVSILWNDPAIGVAWPVTEPLLSEKDKKGLRLADIPAERLPPR